MGQKKSGLRLIRTGVGLGFEIKIRTRSRLELRWICLGFVIRIAGRT